MNGYDLVIPVFNEKKIVYLLDYILKNTKKMHNIYLCYDDESDITLNLINNSAYKKLKNINLIKNSSCGPCEAIKSGIKNTTANAVIIYPADDFHNGSLLDEMYELFENGYDVVCPSRFMDKGTIENCPLIKYILVKFVSLTLFYFSNLNIHDPTNGFRLFSNKFIKNNKIESKLGFAYSLELLIKAKKSNLKVIEIPSIWIERKDRKSSFKIFKWSKEYLKWFFEAFKKN